MKITARGLIFPVLPDKTNTRISPLSRVITSNKVSNQIRNQNNNGPKDKPCSPVVHQIFNFRIITIDMSRKLLDLFANYLSNRRQRVVLNGKSSNWAPILSGTPQGSVFGPLLFLSFINDLEAGIISQIKFFADDTSLYSVVKDPEISEEEKGKLIMISK